MMIIWIFDALTYNCHRREFATTHNAADYAGDDNHAEDDYKNDWNNVIHALF